MDNLILAIVCGIGFSILAWYIGKQAGRIQTLEVLVIYLTKQIPKKQEKKKKQTDNKWRVVGQTLKAKGGN